MNRSIIALSLVMTMLVLACVPVDSEQLVGFWKVENIYFWDESKRQWLPDTTAKQFYNEFKKGGAHCPRSDEFIYFTLTPSETCYLVDGNVLVERGTPTLKEYRWNVHGDTLEIFSEMSLNKGEAVKIKTVSVRASKADALKDGFPYKNPLVMEEVTE